MKKRVGYMVAAALAAALFIAPAMQADQPHMQAALDHLNAAKAELQAAEHDKGGHRDKALAATENAIRQVEAGIRYDRHHD